MSVLVSSADVPAVGASAVALRTDPVAFRIRPAHLFAVLRSVEVRHAVDEPAGAPGDRPTALVADLGVHRLRPPVFRRHQYSSGRRIVVALRSASVMTQI